MNNHNCGVPHSSQLHRDDRGPRRTCSWGWVSGIFARRREPLFLFHTTPTSSFRPEAQPKWRNLWLNRISLAYLQQERPQISHNNKDHSILSNYLCEICGRMFLPAGFSTSLRFGRNDETVVDA